MANTCFLKKKKKFMRKIRVNLTRNPINPTRPARFAMSTYKFDLEVNHLTKPFFFPTRFKYSFSINEILK